MQNLFVIILKYIEPLEIIDQNRAEHLEFLDQYYASNIFIASGRQVTNHGGVIIATSENINTLNDIIKLDPFYKKNLAEYEIYEFTPSKYNIILKDIINT
jgi:uncharacterized protein YciI